DEVESAVRRDGEVDVGIANRSLRRVADVNATPRTPAVIALSKRWMFGLAPAISGGEQGAAGILNDNWLAADDVGMIRLKSQRQHVDGIASCGADAMRRAAHDHRHTENDRNASPRMENTGYAHRYSVAECETASQRSPVPCNIYYVGFGRL